MCLSSLAASVSYTRQLDNSKTISIRPVGLVLISSWRTRCRWAVAHPWRMHAYSVAV